MNKTIITKGLLFREVITNPNHKEKDWLFAFDGSKVRGVRIDGVSIWFPKEYRTIITALDKKALGKMTLKEMEMSNGELAFFLIP